MFWTTGEPGAKLQFEAVLATGLPFFARRVIRLAYAWGGSFSVAEGC